jgi:outer membrane immunogenic protein
MGDTHATAQVLKSRVYAGWGLLMNTRLLGSIAIVTLTLTGSGYAADLAVKAPIKTAPPLATFSWTGCYLGANAGGGRADKGITETNFSGFPETFNRGSYSANGGAFGGQVGCDYQVNNNIVIGIRGLWDGANITGGHSVGPGDTIAGNDNVKIGSFAMIVGKFGFLPDPAVALYGVLGVGFVRDHYFITAPTVGEMFAADQTRAGFDVGAGLAWMFARNWDLWVEYDYIGLGTRNVTLNGERQFTGETLSVDVRQSLSKILVGIDYRFGSWNQTVIGAKY